MAAYRRILWISPRGSRSALEVPAAAVRPDAPGVSRPRNLSVTPAAVSRAVVRTNLAADLQRENSEISEHSEHSENSELRQQIIELKQTIRDRETALQESTNLNLLLQQEVDDVAANSRRRLMEAAEREEHCTIQCSVLQERIKTLEREHEDLRRQIEQREIVIEQMKTDLDNVALQCTNALTENAKLIDEKANLQAHLNKVIKKDLEKKKHIDAITKELETLQRLYRQAPTMTLETPIIRVEAPDQPLNISPPRYTSSPQDQI